MDATQPELKKYRSRYLIGIILTIVLFPIPILFAFFTLATLTLSTGAPPLAILTALLPAIPIATIASGLACYSKSATISNPKSLALFKKLSTMQFSLPFIIVGGFLLPLTSIGNGGLEAVAFLYSAWLGFVIAEDLICIIILILTHYFRSHLKNFNPPSPINQPNP
jgi:hypothetical protein